MLVTAFLCPVLGSISDQIGRRKPGIFILWLVGLICMFGLSFPEPGKDSAVTITLILICWRQLPMKPRLSLQMHCYRICLRSRNSEN